jgi:hypothetical protein
MYLSDAFFHRVGQARDLIPGFSFQMRDSVRQFSVSRLQMLDQIPLVSIQLLLKSLNEGGAIAGVTITYRSLKANINWYHW